ncbi:hypothetical protein BDY21DRAFT_355749 [Lineolata rhizophorae]|uniref:Uncharacterized protein n=1 Tax=Lineolata rhizophorae TaxID=578093 RepID=A0A6A6NNZ5_9PEZI|nr:hypothetical protein BDY21DRAFT_355749 [Lineolata rhizophorae]
MRDAQAPGQLGWYARLHLPSTDTGRASGTSSIPLPRIVHYLGSGSFIRYERGESRDPQRVYHREQLYGHYRTTIRPQSSKILVKSQPTMSCEPSRGQTWQRYWKISYFGTCLGFQTANLPLICQFGSRSMHPRLQASHRKLDTSAETKSPPPNCVSSFLTLTSKHGWARNHRGTIGTHLAPPCAELRAPRRAASGLFRHPSRWFSTRRIPLFEPSARIWGQQIHNYYRPTYFIPRTKAKISFDVRCRDGLLRAPPLTCGGEHFEPGRRCPDCWAEAVWRSRELAEAKPRGLHRGENRRLTSGSLGFVVAAPATEGRCSRGLSAR